MTSAFGERALAFPDRDARRVLRRLLDREAEPQLRALRDERRRHANAQSSSPSERPADVRRVNRRAERDAGVDVVAERLSRRLACRSFSVTRRTTSGTRVEPPTRMTCSMSSMPTFATSRLRASARSQHAIVVSTRSPTTCLVVGATDVAVERDALAGFVLHEVALRDVDDLGRRERLFDLLREVDEPREDARGRRRCPSRRGRASSPSSTSCLRRCSA